MIQTPISGFQTDTSRKGPTAMAGRKGVLFWLAIMLLHLGPPTGAEAKDRPGEIRLGELTVTLTGPEALARVDGRKAQADAYILKTAPRLHLQVLALYADTGEWDRFVTAAAGRRPAAVPRFALLCTTRAMSKKHYDQKSLRRELTLYEKWFNLAAGNRILAALLTRQGNRKLAEIMGVDIGFEFKVDQFTNKFDQSGDSLSLGAKVAFNVFGQPSQVFLTVSAQAVGDKIIFLAYFEKDGQEINKIQDRAKTWRLNLARLNAGLYRPQGQADKKL
jgi:hypothetical protein